MSKTQRILDRTPCDHVGLEPHVVYAAATARYQAVVRCKCGDAAMRSPEHRETFVEAELDGKLIKRKQ